MTDPVLKTTEPVLKTDAYALFPFWPYSYMAFCSHLLRDFGRNAATLAASGDPMEAAQKEGDYGAHLFLDLTKGFYELALLPYTLAISTLAAGADAPGVTADGNGNGPTAPKR